MILLCIISAKYTITTCSTVYCYDKDRELISLLCIQCSINPSIN